MKAWIKPIAKLDACQEALNWAEDYDSLKEAWQNCKHGDWMLWLIGKTITRDADRKPLVLAACECARLALPYVLKGENRPLKAIMAAEAWVRGETTIRKVTVAAYAASTAASAAYTAASAAYAAAYAASTAASAASTAASAAYTAASAAYTAAYAASTAAYAASTAASATTLSKCADIVRKHYPNPRHSPSQIK